MDYRCHRFGPDRALKGAERHLSLSAFRFLPSVFRLWRSAYCSCIAVVWILGLSGASLAAQSQPSGSLDLGVVADVVLPGGKLGVPLTLTTTEDPKIGKISVRVAFPAQQLSFVGTTLGPALEPLAPSIRADAKDLTTTGAQVLEVEIATKAPMPQGLLVFLNFQVGADVKPETEIQLSNLTQSLETVDGNKVQAYGIDGSIRILEPALPCFFYMH